MSPSVALRFPSRPRHAVAKNDPNRFQIGIQEYTFHRWIGRKLDHLDYPALCKDKLGITHIEYWNRPFGGKHTDKKYAGELVKRDHRGRHEERPYLSRREEPARRQGQGPADRAVDEHKGWIDGAAQLGCDAIRVNCRSGGNPDENVQNAKDGVGASATTPRTAK